MKSIRFRDPAGAVRTGTVSEETVRFGSRAYHIGEVDVLPPCTPTKLVCVGRNYPAHAAEFGSDVPERPSLFLKPPNTVAGHGDTVELPDAEKQIDYEAELAVVIDRQCRNVPTAQASDVIRGFTCAVDLSNRDDQRQEQNWVRGKAFDGAAPLGPVIAPPEEVPADASISLEVNGTTEQTATIDQLHFSVSELIAEITEYMTLEPGDVILTGTPEGVGPLTDEDEVTVTIEGIGTLQHTVVMPEDGTTQ